MAAELTPMRCPQCGDAMNHHADKVIYDDADHATRADPVGGEVVEEFYTCPACGVGASRRATG